MENHRFLIFSLVAQRARRPRSSDLRITMAAGSLGGVAHQYCFLHEDAHSDGMPNSGLQIEVIDPTTGEELVDAQVTISPPKSSAEIAKGSSVLLRPPLTSLSPIEASTMGGATATSRLVGCEGSDLTWFSAAEAKREKQEHQQAVRYAASKGSWVLGARRVLSSIETPLAAGWCVSATCPGFLQVATPDSVVWDSLDRPRILISAEVLRSGVCTVLMRMNLHVRFTIVKEVISTPQQSRLSPNKTSAHDAAVPTPSSSYSKQLTCDSKVTGATLLTKTSDAVLGNKSGPKKVERTTSQAPAKEEPKSTTTHGSLEQKAGAPKSKQLSNSPTKEASAKTTGRDSDIGKKLGPSKAKLSAESPVKGSTSSTTSIGATTSYKKKPIEPNVKKLPILIDASPKKKDNSDKSVPATMTTKTTPTKKNASCVPKLPPASSTSAHSMPSKPATLSPTKSANSSPKKSSNSKRGQGKLSEHLLPTPTMLNSEMGVPEGGTTRTGSGEEEEQLHRPTSPKRVIAIEEEDHRDRRLFEQAAKEEEAAKDEVAAKEAQATKEEETAKKEQAAKEAQTVNEIEAAEGREAVVAVPAKEVEVAVEKIETAHSEDPLDDFGPKVRVPIRMPRRPPFGAFAPPIATSTSNNADEDNDKLINNEAGAMAAISEHAPEGEAKASVLVCAAGCEQPIDPSLPFFDLKCAHAFHTHCLLPQLQDQKEHPGAAVGFGMQRLSALPGHPLHEPLTRAKIFCMLPPRTNNNNSSIDITKPKNSTKDSLQCPKCAAAIQRQFTHFECSSGAVIELPAVLNSERFLAFDKPIQWGVKEAAPWEILSVTIPNHKEIRRQRLAAEGEVSLRRLHATTRLSLRTTKHEEVPMAATNATWITTIATMPMEAGESETREERQLVKTLIDNRATLDSKAANPPVKRKMQRGCVVGDKVEARYFESGDWYVGLVTDVTFGLTNKGEDSRPLESGNAGLFADDEPVSYDVLYDHIPEGIRDSTKLEESKLVKGVHSSHVRRLRAISHSLLTSGKRKIIRSVAAVLAKNRFVSFGAEAVIHLGHEMWSDKPGTPLDITITVRASPTNDLQKTKESQQDAELKNGVNCKGAT